METNQAIILQEISKYRKTRENFKIDDINGLGKMEVMII
jgi:hypothetical protein